MTNEAIGRVGGSPWARNSLNAEQMADLEARAERLDATVGISFGRGGYLARASRGNDTVTGARTLRAYEAGCSALAGLEGAA